MERFAVVVCPHCENAFIVEPGPKTVSCRKCNKRLEAAKLKVYFATDDFKAAQDARASIVADRMGDKEIFRQISGSLDADVKPDAGKHDRDKMLVDAKMKDEADRTRKKGQQAILKDTFEELSESGEVEVEEYWKKVSFHGIDRKKFDEWVEKMVQTGVAFYPRFGYLKKS